MGILNGLYRLKTPHAIEETHGGGTLKNEVFWYLAFYRNDDFIGMYGSGPTDYKRYYSKLFELRGQLIKQDMNNIKFYIQNSYTKQKLIFEGATSKDKKQLRLKAHVESTPHKIWMDDVFEYVNLLDDVPCM